MQSEKDLNFANKKQEFSPEEMAAIANAIAQQF